MTHASVKEATSACYWIVGENTDNPAVAVDLHDDDCELIRETWTCKLRPRFHKNYLHEARWIAEQYARSYGVEAARLYHDDDSTQFYANV